MPTARPIIIEKFMDHTDSGVNPVRRWRAAKPTAMPARASSRGRPAAMAEPNATASRTMVGRPETSSARCRASSFSALKSLHTGHSPVTSARAPSGRDSALTWAMSSPADSGRSASSVPARATGTRAVVPSASIRPASGGREVGSTTAPAPGAPCRSATKASRPAGSSVTGVSWV